MQGILSKRIFRSLKNNLFRYLALFLLIVLGMYIDIAVVDAADTIIQGVAENNEGKRVEDGQFRVFVPLTEEEREELENTGIVIEEQFYMDYVMENQSTVRIYKNREWMNLLSIAEGTVPEVSDQIFLEQHYAEGNHYRIGSAIRIGERNYQVVGVGSTPDYDAVLKNLSDVTVEHRLFGTAFVCEADYEKMEAEGRSSKAEEYTYGYRLNGSMTDDELKDRLLEMEVDNLTSFLRREDNARIAASVDDVMINKNAGILAGIIVMILFTYVISVFVIHEIEQECSVIGALYALGVKRKQLLLHYTLLPVLITLFGSLVGTMLGFSPFGADVQMMESIKYFSLPVLKTRVPLYLILFGVIMPPIAAAIVNCIVINSKLKQPALSMLRNEQKVSKIRKVNLGNMGFVRRFQIRQLLRELRSAVTVLLGMFISMLLLMIGVNCYTLCTNYAKNAERDATFEYMYTYKYPEAQVPEGGEACYVESFKKEALGCLLDVSIIGMDEGNPYFDTEVGENQNDIVISSAVSDKFNVNAGDKLVLSDDINDRDYAFTVRKVIPLDTMMFTFMDIDAMRELFGQDEDYYNVVFSDRELDIESERLYSVTSRADIIDNSVVFIKQMMPLISGMTGISIIVFVVVMYLMMKVMIDRSAFSIALMKIFGYRKREIKKLYIDGNTIVIVIGAAICLPLTKWCMDALYPYLTSNVGIALNLTFSPLTWGSIYLGVILCYLVINQLLTGRLKKLIPAEVLKNRE